MAGSSFEAMRVAVEDVGYLGFPMSELLVQLSQEVISHTTLSDYDKAVISEKIAQVKIISL